MTKTISTRQLAQLKRNFQNVYPMFAKREKILEKMKALKEEYDAMTEVINNLESVSRMITGGLNSTQLLRREVITTNAVDKDGHPVKQTKIFPIENVLVVNENGTYTINFPDVEPEDTVAEATNE